MVWGNVLAAKRILLLWSVMSLHTGCLRSSIRKFYEKYNCVWYHLMRFQMLKTKTLFKTMLLSITLNQKEPRKPDLIITFGTKYFKTLTHVLVGMFEHRGNQ